MFEIFAVVGSILLSFLVIFKSGEVKGKRKVIDNLRKETKEKLKKDEKLKKNIADTKFSDRISKLQKISTNRRRTY